MATQLQTRTAGPTAAVCLPGRFRFSDVNPETGTPLAQCRTLDLPESVAVVVDEVLRLSGHAWDRLVEDGMVGEVVELHAVFSVPARVTSGRLLGTYQGPASGWQW